MKILVAEDYEPSAKILAQFLELKGYEVKVGRDGLEALSLAESEKFDVLLTDCMMPRMNGMELIQQVRERVEPVPLILMITALSDNESRLAALSAGADEFITKPYSMYEVIRLLESLVARREQQFSASFDTSGVVNGYGGNPPFPAVFIAASTGGTEAITRLFDGFPVGMPAPICVVLHGPKWMLADFSAQLQRTSAIPVILAQDGMKPEPGKLYIAPGERHLEFKPDFSFSTVDSPQVNFVKPAADRLFVTGAAAFGKFCAGAVLTGMGIDGVAGAVEVSRAGGMVIAQDPSESTVAGMPQGVIDRGIADYVLPIAMMPGIIFNKVQRLATDVQTA